MKILVDLQQTVLTEYKRYQTLPYKLHIISINNLAYLQSLCTLEHFESYSWCILQNTTLYIFNKTQGLTPSRICGILFQGHGCSGNDQSFEWTVDVTLGSKPKINGNGDSRADVRKIKKTMW